MFVSISTLLTLASVLIVLMLVLSVSLYYNYKHGVLLLKIVDSVESSLDVLDEKYAIMSKILEIPIFYDSPQIKQVVTEIKACKDSILKVAQEIGTIEEFEEVGQDA